MDFNIPDYGKIKLYKFASISNIENQLVNENIIDLKTFLTLCPLENINVFLSTREHIMK